MDGSNQNYMNPSGQPYAFDAFSFSWSVWMKEPDTSNGREFVFFDATGGGNDTCQFVLDNAAATTPASYTSLAMETIVAQGSKNVPDWGGNILIGVA